MATAAGEEGVEYASDQEESKQLLTMRRQKVASDDEDNEGGGAVDTCPNNVGPIHFDESDGECRCSQRFRYCRTNSCGAGSGGAGSGGDSCDVGGSDDHCSLFSQII